MFKKNTIGAYLLMYMYMFILKIPLNSSQHVGVGGAWYDCALYRKNDMDCDSLYYSVMSNSETLFNSIFLSMYAGS